MQKVVQITSLQRREDAIAELQRILPACVRDTVAEVGVDGLRSFFDGYKQSPEQTKLAA